MKKASFIISLLLIVLGLSPLVVAFAGIGLAEALGCAISSAGPEECLVVGLDIGPTLAIMMMMHWLAILGLPLAALGALGLLITGLVHLFTRRR